MVQVPLEYLQVSDEQPCLFLYLIETFSLFISYLWEGCRECSYLMVFLMCLSYSWKSSERLIRSPPFWGKLCNICLEKGFAVIYECRLRLFERNKPILGNPLPTPPPPPMCYDDSAFILYISRFTETLIWGPTLSWFACSAFVFSLHVVAGIVLPRFPFSSPHFHVFCPFFFKDLNLPSDIFLNLSPPPSFLLVTVHPCILTRSLKEGPRWRSGRSLRLSRRLIREKN